jgi:hypothetical protein
MPHFFVTLTIMKITKATIMKVIKATRKLPGRKKVFSVKSRRPNRQTQNRMLSIELEKRSNKKGV